MPGVILDYNDATNSSINQAEIQKHLELILRRLSVVGTVGIEISLVKDPKIQQLNAKYLKKDQPTDVLSFNNPEYTEGSQMPIGSVVISVDTAAKQAKEAGVTLQNETNILAGHGLLHLLGYNHS